MRAHRSLGRTRGRLPSRASNLGPGRYDASLLSATGSFEILDRVTLNQALDQTPTVPGYVGPANYTVAPVGNATIAYTATTPITCTVTQNVSLTVTNIDIHIPAEQTWTDAEKAKAPADEIASWNRFIADVRAHETGHHNDEASLAFASRTLTATGSGANQAAARTAAMTDLSNQINNIITATQNAGNSLETAWHNRVGATINVGPYKITNPSRN